MKNFINLQRVGDFPLNGDNGTEWDGKEAGSSNNPPIDNINLHNSNNFERPPYTVTTNSFDDISTIESKSNYDKFKELVSDEVSLVHDMMKRGKKDIWDLAKHYFEVYINENPTPYEPKTTYVDFINWAKQNYTLINK